MAGCSRVQRLLLNACIICGGRRLEFWKLSGRICTAGAKRKHGVRLRRCGRVRILSAFAPRSRKRGTAECGRRWMESLQRRRLDGRNARPSSTSPKWRKAGLRSFRHSRFCFVGLLRRVWIRELPAQRSSSIWWLMRRGKYAAWSRQGEQSPSMQICCRRRGDGSSSLRRMAAGLSRAEHAWPFRQDGDSQITCCFSAALLGPLRAAPPLISPELNKPSPAGRRLLHSLVVLSRVLRAVALLLRKCRRRSRHQPG
jgi:hypothetical protein